MKKFLLNIILFGCMVLVYFGFSSLVNMLIIQRTGPNLKESSILVIGDSHPRKAINPKYLPNSINISQSSEPYILTYWKLKKVYKSVKADTVLIGFGHQNISAHNDLKFSKDLWASEMLIRSYAVLDFEDFSKIDIDYLTFGKILFRQMFLYPHRDHIKYIERFSNNHNNDVSDASLVVERHYTYDDKKLGISELSVNYLDQILEFCTKNKITPILVTTPVHPSYYSLIPTKIKHRFDQEKNRLMKKGILIIDESITPYPDSNFLNTDHLNLDGAENFTHNLRRLMKSN